MKTYPSINTNILLDEYVYLFDKLDGSNLRFEWDKKKGFYKFGSRSKLIDQNTPILGEAIDLFMSTHAPILHQRFKERSVEKSICFGEFFGESSFAGQHQKEEAKKILLFDISIHRKGFLNPQDFLELSKEVPSAPLLYEGMLTKEIIHKIKNSLLENMSKEGVIAKINNPKNNGPIMFKIKTYQWLEMLKKKCDGNEELFNKLK